MSSTVSPLLIVEDDLALQKQINASEILGVSRRMFYDLIRRRSIK